MIDWSGRDDDRRSVSRVALGVTVLLCALVGLVRFAEFRDVDPSLVGLTDQPDGWYLSYDGELDRDIGSVSFDVYEYHAYVEHFRGEFDRDPIYGPWRWRLVPSWIASWTPIDNPAVAYAAVSLVFLACGGAALVAASARNGFGPRRQLATGALYAVSFPLLWYGTSGYVDGSLVAALCIGLYLIQTRRWAWFLLWLPVGLLVKETFLIIVPVAATYLWVRARERRDWLPLTLAAVALVAVTFVGIRMALTTPRTLDWMPRWNRFGWNISRPQALVSFVLTCGIPVPLGLWRSRQLLRGRDTGEGRDSFARNLHLIVGLGMGLLVAFHGFITAYADGRHAWTTYPFAAILAVQAASMLIARRSGAATPADSTT